jgi:hypothetical protein
MNILSLDLKAVNFEDEISIRRGECNTPIKTNLLLEKIFSIGAINKGFQ